MCDGPSTDWKAESDHRSLMSAAEVMADRVRMRGVIVQQNKQRRAMATMEKMLAGFRNRGAFKDSGVIKIKRGRGPVDVASGLFDPGISSGVTAIEYQEA